MGSVGDKYELCVSPLAALAPPRVFGRDFVQINFGHKSRNLGSATCLKVVSRLQYNSRRKTMNQQQQKAENSKVSRTQCIQTSTFAWELSWQNWPWVLISSPTVLILTIMMRMMTLAANTIRRDGDPGRVFNAAPATTWAAMPPVVHCGFALQCY